MGQAVHIQRKYLVSDKDRHGNVRYYVRRPGEKKVRIKAEPGTPEFDRLYWTAIKAGPEPEKLIRYSTNSLGWLITQFYNSAEFLSKAEATQLQRRSILNRIKNDTGEIPFRAVTTAMIKQGRDNRAATPGAANNFIKVVKALYDWAIEAEHTNFNPAQGVKRIPLKASTWTPWTLEQCLAYEERHPLGTPARTAYALARYGGLRLSDVRILGRQHYRDGWILLPAQTKTKAPVEFPVRAELAEALDACQSTGLHFVETAHGNPYKTAQSFERATKRWIKEAGVTGVFHGLRKSLGVTMAESGATEEQIAAALGHTSTSTVHVYTKGANRRLLAGAAHGTIQKRS